MRIVDTLTETWERICIYGSPKTGKSRLATSLPWGGYFGEKAVYAAIDPNSEALRSVRPVDRPHLTTVVLDGKPSYLEEAVQVATTDWVKQGMKTLIWDTMTHMGMLLLRQYADSGVFSDKHAVQLGRQGTKSWHTNPMLGDYGAAQNSIGFLIQHLFALPMHVIVIFHEKFVEPKEGSPEGIAGGPDVVGSKAVRWISGNFDSVFRTDVGLNPETKRVGFMVHSMTRGIWKAGFRTPRDKQSLMTPYPLSTDPSEFWKAYLKDVEGGE